MGALPLDVDLDLLADVVDESLPWFEAWAALLALMLGLVVLAAARDYVRRRNDPVARIMRRRRS
ncbi:hypothetical protein [Bradyrhizobium sp. RT9a]|uniref:hypothetical protein n=1 Tax=Bradyrhizobium sp. RT9a TaxID=3156384 RepID=UPI003399E223